MRVRFVPGSGLLLWLALGVVVTIVALAAGMSVAAAHRLAGAWTAVLMAAALLDRHTAR